MTKKTMNVRMGVFYGEFSSRELDDLDFEDAGNQIANCVGVMNAIYCVAKNITSSAKQGGDEPSNRGAG